MPRAFLVCHWGEMDKYEAIGEVNEAQCSILCGHSEDTLRLIYEWVNVILPNKFAGNLCGQYFLKLRIKAE